MMSSRWGPRKPGQSAPVSAAAGPRQCSHGAPPARCRTPRALCRCLPELRWRRTAGCAAGAWRSGHYRLGQEPFLGSLRPPPMQVVIEGAGEAAGPDERPHSTREQDGRDHRHAPRSVRETTGGHRPRDEGEAQDRDSQDDQQHPLRPRRNRHVNEARCREQRGDHQDDGAQALGPRRPAKEQPPQDDGQPAGESRQAIRRAWPRARRRGRQT